MADPVFIGPGNRGEIQATLHSFRKKGGIFLLADKNTYKYCLPLLKSFVPKMNEVPAYIISGGERSKNLNTLRRIWNWLMESGAARDSLLVNLGGGVVSDLGGFAASTYKRGLAYVNVPTSLIGQADAAIGGKTGINVSGIKNQAGVFYAPLAVFIIPGFLVTLPARQLRSGFAEIIKSALLAGNGFWQCMQEKDAHKDGNLESMIAMSSAFKSRVVRSDPYELGRRRILNFGHTIGHAIEGMSFLPGRKKLLHGEAVAAGMICEAFISHRMAGLPENELNGISRLVRAYFRLPGIEKLDYETVIKLIRHDKKRSSGVTGFTLISAPGNPVIDITVNEGLLIDSFEYFNGQIRS